MESHNRLHSEGIRLLENSLSLETVALQNPKDFRHFHSSITLQTLNAVFSIASIVTMTVTAMAALIFIIYSNSYHLLQPLNSIHFRQSDVLTFSSKKEENTFFKIKKGHPFLPVTVSPQPYLYIFLFLFVFFCFSIEPFFSLFFFYSLSC